MAKVILDAGHGGMDPGAVYQGRQEKDDNLRLALAVGSILENNGVDVSYTRTNDVYDSPYQKAVLANEAGGEYLISFHRNAAAVPGNASGSQVLVYADKGPASVLARDINRRLIALGFNDLGIIERPGLAVLKRSAMPAVLVETGFLDSNNDNELFDSSFEEITQGIAEGILEALGNDDDDESSASSIESETRKQESRRRPSDSSQPKLYRVQAGAFRSQTSAYELNEQLTEEGFPSFIILDNGLYKVQVGAFLRLENAIRMEYRLRAAGYDTYITT